MLRGRPIYRLKPGLNPALFFLIALLQNILAGNSAASPKFHDAVPRPGTTVAASASFNGVFRQQESYSCGTAALASLLTYWTGDNITEDALLERLRALLGPSGNERIVARGLEKGDLTALASSFGYQQQWRTVSTEEYRQVREPVIIFMVYQGEPHWTIYKGSKNGEVFLADPSLGNVRMPTSEFEKIWAILEGSTRGLMWAVQRADVRNLGQQSPLIDLSPTGHRTLGELRALAAFGRAPGKRHSLTTTLSKSRSSTQVDLLGQVVVLSTSQIELKQSWSLDLGNARIADVSLPYSRSSTRAALGSSVVDERESGWRDLTLSILQLISIDTATIAAFGATLQVPTNSGARGVGFSASIAWSHEPLTTSLSARHLSQFTGSSELSVQSRPRSSAHVAITSQLNLDRSNSLSVSATYGSSGTKTLGLGTAPRQTYSSLEASIETIVGRQYQLRPTLSITRSHGTIDRMVSIAVTNTF